MATPTALTLVSQNVITSVSQLPAAAANRQNYVFYAGATFVDNISGQTIQTGYTYYWLTSLARWINTSVGGGGGSVTSVNGQTGVVVLTTTNIAEGANLYFTQSRAINSVLSTYALGSNTAVASTDTVVQAFGKVQAQLNTKQGSAYQTNQALSPGSNVLLLTVNMIQFWYDGTNQQIYFRNTDSVNHSYYYTCNFYNSVSASVAVITSGNALGVIAPSQNIYLSATGVLNTATNVSSVNGLMDIVKIGLIQGAVSYSFTGSVEYNGTKNIIKLTGDQY